MKQQAVRWNVMVSKDTDVALADYMQSQGMKKTDRSKFVEEAVCRHVLQCTIQDIRSRNASASPDEIQRIVDEAVAEVRAERRAHRKAS